MEVVDEEERNKEEETKVEGEEGCDEHGRKAGAGGGGARTRSGEASEEVVNEEGQEGEKGMNEEE